MKKKLQKPEEIEQNIVKKFLKFTAMSFNENTSKLKSTKEREPKLPEKMVKNAYKRILIGLENCELAF